jgi:solute carrier family 25 phosphate transporter 23/24/25/41
MQKIVKFEGPLALYKGWGAAVLGIVPYASIDLAVFNTLKENYINKYSDQPSIMTLLLCGATSSVCG